MLFCIILACTFYEDGGGRKKKGTTADLKMSNALHWHY